MSREHCITVKVGGAVDRNDARPKDPFGLRDGITADPAIPGDPCGKAGQRAVGFRELQPAKAGRIDRSCGIGRRGMPGERQNRAVWQELLS